MLTAAIILFFVSAFFGFFILKAILKDKPTPGPIVFVHGILSIFALLVLTAYTIGHMSTLLIVSDVLLIVAAAGGFTMLAIDMNNKPVPKLIAIFHPILAGAGLIVLLVYFISGLMAS